jgi:hypothetical protein
MSCRSLDGAPREIPECYRPDPRFEARESRKIAIFPVILHLVM